MPVSNTHARIETRDRLLEAALQAFGNRDYDGVSTREIVEKAEANISAISYHFGGKKGLYLATVAYLADRLHAGMAEQLEQIRQHAEVASPHQCAESLCRFLLHFLENMLLGEVGKHAPGIIFREQSQPTDAFEILYDKLLAPMHGTLARLVARYRGLQATDQAVIIMVHALIGQTMIFRIGRTTFLRRMGTPAFDAANLEAVKRQLRHYYMAILNTTPDSINTDIPHDA
ncbi:MAG: CerR family C-terminal domain-containing protein [Candidatus Thiodiazotropha sp. (ex Epidulcina cf. delphinae)]|nr:CerR family C-terminal domain-containing protein [Candidatus Thiodiazotropha sp. (ex Epidulcina cf. delphinae)]